MFSRTSSPPRERKRTWWRCRPLVDPQRQHSSCSKWRRRRRAGSRRRIQSGTYIAFRKFQSDATRIWSRRARTARFTHARPTLKVIVIRPERLRQSLLKHQQFSRAEVKDRAPREPRLVGPLRGSETNGHLQSPIRSRGTTPRSRSRPM